MMNERRLVIVTDLRTSEVYGLNTMKQWNRALNIIRKNGTDSSELFFENSEGIQLSKSDALRILKENV